VGVAVVAMMAVTSPPAGRGEVPGRPVVPASIPTSVTTPAGVRDQVGGGSTADVDVAAFGR
jgi:hypothetical protein